VKIIDSTLSYNSAHVGVGYDTSSGIGGSGGGIANGFNLTVSNSTLYGNSADTTGGGIFVNSAYTTALIDATLTANRANVTGGESTGGGLFVSRPSSATLHNTLIAGNFNGRSGTTPDDVSGTQSSSSDHNLIGVGTGMTGLSNGVNGNLVGTAASPIDPKLGPLQDNGGPTQTCALGTGSPALAAGGPSGTLDGAVNASTTSVFVYYSTGGVAVAVGQTIQIDSEQMTVTSFSSPVGYLTLHVVRGVNGTTAAPHARSAAVFLDHTDQRGHLRLRNGTIDIGAFEAP
jgi:hypothetical protein